MEHKDANHGKQRRKVAIDEANHGKQRRRSMKATKLLVYREWAKTSCNMHDKKIKVKEGAQQKKVHQPAQSTSIFLSRMLHHENHCTEAIPNCTESIPYCTESTMPFTI